MTLIGAEARLKVLMLASLEGDARAYRLLLDALRGGLGAYFRRRLGTNAADEEDLVQETLIAMHNRRGSYDVTQPVTAWVYAIARYKLIDHYRRRRVRQTVPLEDAGPLFAGEGIDTALEAAMARLDLDRMLSDLPAATRRLVLATKLEGRSHGEAADAEGLSETAAKVRVHRGLKSLTDRFAPGQGAKKGGGLGDG